LVTVHVTVSPDATSKAAVRPSICVLGASHTIDASVDPGKSNSRTVTRPGTTLLKVLVLLVPLPSSTSANR
jgi:hypothetical protein